MSRELLRVTHEGKPLLVLWSHNTDSPIAAFRTEAQFRAWVLADLSRDLERRAERMANDYLDIATSNRLPTLVGMCRMPGLPKRNPAAWLLATCAQDADQR